MSASKPSRSLDGQPSTQRPRNVESAAPCFVRDAHKLAALETQAQRIARQAKAAVMKSAGLGECSQLCDVAEVEHVCDLVLEEFAAARLGAACRPPAFIAALQQNLIAPLVRYAGTLAVPKRSDGFGAGRRMEAQPTAELISAAAEVQRHLADGPWAETDAKRAAQLLETAWLRWIAYVSSYWLWDRVPALLVEKQIRREQGKLGKGVPRTGEMRATSNKDAIIRLAERLAKTKAAHEVAGAVAQQLNYSPQWVRRVLKEHALQKTKLKPTL